MLMENIAKEKQIFFTVMKACLTSRFAVELQNTIMSQFG